LRTNKAVRPGYLEINPDICKPLEETQYGQSLPIFLEMLPADDEREALPAFDKENDVILFFKMYDPISETLHYCGHWCVAISISFNEVAAECRRRANWGPDVPITLYEEVQQGQFEKIQDLNVLLDQGLDELMDGDIVVFHRTFDPSRKLKSLSEFYTYVQYKYEITFIDKSNTNDSFVIEMSLKSSYMEMATKVGQRLGVKPLYIQFFKCQPYKDSPAYPVKFEQESPDLLTIFPPTHKSTRSSYKLFYQVLGIPVTDLEHKKQFKLLYYSPEDQEREVVFYVNKQPRILVKDVLGELARVISEEENKPVRNLRLVEISSHRICNIVDEDASADIIQNNTSATRYYRAEEILPEEVDISPPECLVQVAHFHKDPRSTFGIPFLIKIKFGELWSHVKQRIQSRLGMNEKDWAKIRIALVQQGSPNFLEKEDEEVVIKPDIFNSYSGSFNSKPWIGVEHVNKAPKRSRYSTLEKAIKIYN
jgi:ubiquitin carboxyl-terminal hydrolase 7